jgi:hypothetical protein
VKGVVALMMNLAEAERDGSLRGEEVRGDDIFDIDAPVEVLVYLGVGIGVGFTHSGIVILFGEEARGPENDAGKAVVAVEELAEVFGRGLGRAVDVLGDGVVSSVIHAAGAPGGGMRASPKTLVVLVKMKRDTPAATALFEQIEGAGDVGVDEILAGVGGDVGLVERGGVEDGVHAGHDAADAGAVDDRAGVGGAGLSRMSSPRVHDRGRGGFGRGLRRDGRSCR